MIYEVLRIQLHGDGAEIDVVEIGLQRQALKRAPPFAGRYDSTISPFIRRFWLQLRITGQVRENGFQSRSWTPRIYDIGTLDLHPAKQIAQGRSVIRFAIGGANGETRVDRLPAHGEFRSFGATKITEVLKSFLVI